MFNFKIISKKRFNELKKLEDSIVELTDVFKPNPSRSPHQLKQDAIMQLKNEIAKSGAGKYKKIEDGMYEVKIKVLREN
jgi:hypothetical protein